MYNQTIDWRFFKSLEDPVTVKLTFALTDLSIGDEVVPMLHTDVITTHTKTVGFLSIYKVFPVNDNI